MTFRKRIAGQFVSILTDQRPPQAAWWQRVPLPHFRPGLPDGGRSREEQRLLVSLALIALPALLLLMSGFIAGGPPAAGEVERGVKVAGYPVDGANWDRVSTGLTTRFDAYLSQPLLFQVDGRQTEIAPRDLGITFDIEATYERALGVGRGGALSAGAERLVAHTRGINVDPVVTFDAARLSATLETLGAGIISPPVNARYALDGERLVIYASADGTGLDATGAAAQLMQVLVQLKHGPIVVQTVPVRPAIPSEALEALYPQAAAMLAEPLLVTDGTQYWQITPVALVDLLQYRDGKLAIDTLMLTPLIDSLAASINRPGEGAVVVHNGDGTFRVEAELKERTLDVPASVREVERGLLGGKHQIALVTTERAPEITAPALQPLVQRGNEIAGRGMTVWWADGQQELDRAAYADTLRFDEATLTVRFDHDALFRLLEPIARSINRPSSGYKWINWEIIAPDGAEPGRITDISASVNRVATAALHGENSVELAVTYQSSPAEIGSAVQIQDLLGSASTYYGNSSANRRTNVELAAASLNGTLVQPGGMFSFNQAIGGTATLDDGYQLGFGIVAGEDGVPRTVPSVAGGICQVSTTVFQAAWWAGMPIGERSWHLYWIPNYGSGPGGLKGLDSTVEPDYGLDFTFFNPTEQWIAVRAVTDGEWLTVEVWGTNQGWEIRVSEPQIYNVVKADQAMHRQTTDQLPAGQEVIVERAEDGFTATNHRVVLKDGQVIDEVYLTSYYQPSRNVTLVGTGGGGVAPQPTPTPQPAPAPEPTAEPAHEPVQEPTEEPTQEPAPTSEAEATPTP
jgi:vancomycin resistance protein YoaR